MSQTPGFLAAAVISSQATQLPANPTRHRPKGTTAWPLLANVPARSLECLHGAREAGACPHCEAVRAARGPVPEPMGPLATFVVLWVYLPIACVAALFV